MPELFAHNPLGQPFIELQSVDSTNNYARKLIHEELAAHGTALFAHEQLAGKGQRGKSWTTRKGDNIIMSIIAKPLPLQLSQQFEFSACISLAVRHFFSKYAGNNTLIKWPNDLYYQDKKAGGILIENVVTSQQVKSGQWQWAIIGVGININQADFPSELANPISLRQITGQHFDIIVLAKELCAVINIYFEKLITTGFETIYADYISHLYKKNELVRLKKGNRVFEAVIKNVSRAGRLIIEHDIEEEIDFGAVEWIIEKAK